MNHKLPLVIFILILLAMPLFAYSIGAQVFASGGLSFAIPTADYLKTDNGPVARTSVWGVVDCEFLDMEYGKTPGAVEFGIGISVERTEKSLPFNGTIYRGYLAKGFSMRVSGRVSSSVQLGLRFRSLTSEYPASKSIFSSYDVELVPVFTLQEWRNATLSLVTPLTTSIKADTVTTRLSLGASLWLGVKGEK